MTYTTARKSLALLQSCPSAQLQRLRDKSHAYIAQGGDRLDAKVNRSIQHVCRERNI